MRVRVVRYGAALAAVLVLGGTVAAQGPVTVRVGTLKLVGGAPLFWAEERGYFRQEGLDVRMVYFGAAAPVATATASGDVEVGATGITGTLFNLAAGGARIWLVADRGQERPGYPLNAVVVPRSSYEAGVRSLRDLRGKRVGLTTLGSTFHYQIAKLLERERLTPQDVELVPLRDLSLVVQALRATAPAGVVVCGGIHMSDIPSFPYRLLWEERVVRSVANLTRADAEEFLALAPQVPVRVRATPYPLEEVNRALEDLRRGRLVGSAVVVLRQNPRAAVP